MVVGGVMIVVEEAVEEAVVAEGDVWVAVEVSNGVVDVYVSFIVVCVVEVAGLVVVIFLHGEDAKLKQKVKRIKESDSPFNM